MDLDHYIGADLSYSDISDLRGVTDKKKGEQRVLRRLLTNPGDYLWHADYGAGLARKVGTTFRIDEVKALIRSQMFMEAAVLRNPEPTIDINLIAPGSVNVRIRYTDAATGEPVLLSFDPNK